MWPNYYYLEARRLAAERTVEAELAEPWSGSPSATERLGGSFQPEPNGDELAPAGGCQLALTIGRLRLARALDERVAADGPGSTQAQLR